jgi:transposase
VRYELTDKEWTAINPMLPNKPRGAPRVNDRRVLNGIFCVLRSRAPWRDLPNNFGPYTTCYNRFAHWRRAGVWAKIMSALAEAHDVAVQMIDTSIVRVHQHGSCITRNRRQSMGAVLAERCSSTMRERHLASMALARTTSTRPSAGTVLVRFMAMLGSSERIREVANS